MPTATALHCSIITPEARVFEGPAEFVAIPAHDGEIGILPQRAPLVARLGAGRLRLRAPGGTEQSWFIDSGFAQVLENRVVVLSQRALRPEQIEVSKAQEQLAAARALRADDEAALKRKAAAEASARAQLRMAGRA